MSDKHSLRAGSYTLRLKQSKAASTSCITHQLVSRGFAFAYTATHEPAYRLVWTWTRNACKYIFFTFCKMPFLRCSVTGIHFHTLQAWWLDLHKLELKVVLSWTCSKFIFVCLLLDCFAVHFLFIKLGTGVGIVLWM